MNPAQHEAVSAALYASIARGDLHLYIVKTSTFFEVEVCHVGHLLKFGVETCLRFQKPDPEFAEAYPVGKMVWIAAGPDEWDVRPVTTMDERAREEYNLVMQKLFPKSGVIDRAIADLKISGRNPRQPKDETRTLSKKISLY
jgi:hypothetical protein